MVTIKLASSYLVEKAEAYFQRACMTTYVYVSIHAINRPTSMHAYVQTSISLSNVNVEVSANLKS